MKYIPAGRIGLNVTAKRTQNGKVKRDIQTILRKSECLSLDKVPETLSENSNVPFA